MLYTKKGDGGTTKLFHSKPGERVSKGSLVFEALGTVDELNTHIGYAKALSTSTQKDLFKLKDESYQIILEKIQQNLFSLQAELGGESFYLSDAHVSYLEDKIAEIESALPPINSFLVPGGGLVGAYLDVTRTVARRAERLVVRLKESETKNINDFSLKYINRLSSILYAMARYANFLEGFTEDKPNYK